LQTRRSSLSRRGNTDSGYAEQQRRRFRRNMRGGGGGGEKTHTASSELPIFVAPEL
jgi:hypothetical protein